MLTLINANRMQPPIAPVGIDYLAASLKMAGEAVEVLDLGLADDPATALERHLGRSEPELVAVGFRNVDDCFWPSGAWFVPELAELLGQICAATAAPIVLGGVGYSIFPAEVLRLSGAQFGICGDGEAPLVRLLEELRGARRWDRVPGLLWRAGDAVRANPPHWPAEVDVPPLRDWIDNTRYFRRGGQVGVETKRGCPRACTYCVDPLAKGGAARLRDPETVATEFAALAEQQVEAVHLCDAEFNLPIGHAREVCDALIRRRIADRVRWYAYLAVVPFDDDLAARMARAGCVGINFTSDSAHGAMLAAYGQPHRRDDLAEAVQLCRRHGIRTMLDLLLGGPGETEGTVTESIGFFRRIEPDCVGAALGVRLYPGTPLTRRLIGDGSRIPAGIHRRYEGPLALVRPTFYISPQLGPRPAAFVRECIGDDRRFFEPMDDPAESAGGAADKETNAAPGDHNYNASKVLADAIGDGARGAYWDILRALRLGEPLP